MPSFGFTWVSIQFTWHECLHSGLYLFETDFRDPAITWLYFRLRWWLHLDFILENNSNKFYLKTTPMNFTREKNSELYLGTTTMNFTYISEKMNFTWEHVLRLLKMILGSRPVNLVWNHFPWTFGQSYLTETVFFLDSTRHLNLHEMPHLIIKCIQLVILSTCFFWNSMSLLVKNSRTILYKVACGFHS